MNDLVEFFLIVIVVFVVAITGASLTYVPYYKTQVQCEESLARDKSCEQVWKVSYE